MMAGRALTDVAGPGLKGAAPPSIPLSASRGRALVGGGSVCLAMEGALRRNHGLAVTRTAAVSKFGEYSRYLPTCLTPTHRSADWNSYVLQVQFSNSFLVEACDA